MSELERSNAELRAAIRIAGKRIKQLQFGRKDDDPVLNKLRQVPQEAQKTARKHRAFRFALLQ